MRLSPALSVLLLPLAACGDPVVVKDYLTVINVSPAHGSVEVSADAEVFVTFNGALDESTVEGRVFIQDSAEAVVAAEWVYLADDLTVQLTPSEPLFLGETYTVVLAEGLTSDLGELPATIRTEFTVTTDGVIPTDDLLADGGASRWTLVEDPSGGQSSLTGVDLPRRRARGRLHHRPHRERETSGKPLRCPATCRPRLFAWTVVAKGREGAGGGRPQRRPVG
jgi:hypothetical protein